MSSCNPLVFNNVTVGIFQSIAKAITAKYGIPIPGYSGTQSKYGFTINWNFAAAQATLTVQCLAYPLFIGCDWVNSDIQAIAASFGLTVAQTGPVAQTPVAKSVAPVQAGSMAQTPVAKAFAPLVVRSKMVFAPAAPPPSDACSPLVFNNITVGQFQSLAQAFTARYGIQLNGPVGTVSGRGFTFSWNFNGAANTLTIQCVAHPSLFGCPLIISEIKMVAASFGLTAAQTGPVAQTSGAKVVAPVQAGSMARTPVAKAFAPSVFRSKMALLALGAPPPSDACSPLVFNNITAAKFQSLAQAFNARYGIQPNGPAGTVSGRGFTFSWNFNGAANTLTIQCVAHPNLFGCPLINADIEMVASSLGLTSA